MLQCVVGTSHSFRWVDQIYNFHLNKGYFQLRKNNHFLKVRDKSQRITQNYSRMLRNSIMKLIM